MNQEIQEALIKYNTKHQRLHDNPTHITFDNNIMKQILNNNRQFQKGTAVANWDSRNIEVTFDSKEHLAQFLLDDKRSKLKNSIENFKEHANLDDPLVKTKMAAIQDIEKETRSYKSHSEKPLNDKQQSILMDIVVAHELSHIHFYTKNTPNYDSRINTIAVASPVNQIQNIGGIRDEIRADVLAILLVKQEYGNDKDFKEVLGRLADIRMMASVDALANNQSMYSMYHVYNDNAKFIQSLPFLNKETLPLIEKKVDELVLKTLKDFGIQAQQIEGVSNNKEELISNIQNSNQAIIEHCESPAVEKYNNVFGSSFERCLNHFNYSDKTASSNQLEKFLSKVPVADGYNSFSFEEFAKNNQKNDKTEENLTTGFNLSR